MKPVLTPAESAALDVASRERGVTVDTLMERAGRAVARTVADLAGGCYGRRVLVVAGKGNNGGDGLVAARRLHGWGMGATVLLLCDPADLSGAAAANFRRFAARGGRWRRWTIQRMHRELARSDVSIDAIFGTGFHGEPTGEAQAAIQSLTESGGPVVAVDVPSGVEGESGAVRGVAVRADATVTLGALKPGLVFFPGAAYAGDVQVADIGFPPGLVRSDLWTMERDDVAALLLPREAESHKRAAGVVVVVAGSRSMTGAAILSATAAYRAGAGLVTLAVPKSILPVVEGAIIETTFLPLPETPGGSVAADAWPALEERLSAAGSVAVGPGLGTEPSTVELVRRVVAECPVPFVLDADGLNAFQGQAAELARRRSPAILTPHPGEFGRLAGLTSKEVLEDRVEHARKLASEIGCTVLLKGSRTVVAEPTGRARINPTGGPYLATGGTGDVLTGAIGAFLARGLTPPDAGVLAAWVHGEAGRIAASRLGEGTTASDVLERLPEAVELLTREEPA